MLSDFRFGFQREKVGAKGVSLRRQGVRTLRKGLGSGISGLLAALGGPARPAGPRPAQQPPAPDSGGMAPGRQRQGRRLLRPSPGPGWRKLRVPRFPPLHRGAWGPGTVCLPGLISLVRSVPDNPRGSRRPGAFGFW